MYAIVDFKGVQLKVEKDTLVKVPYLGELEAGARIEMDKVLMIRTDSDVEIGQPLVEKAKVIAEFVMNGKDDKIIIFHKKRRKGYAKKNGHRQRFSQIKISEIKN
jgi:large subunit ribosomal protein L21